MNRTVVMTLGFLFVFSGIQFNVVDSYVLTPRMANFLADNSPVAVPSPNNVVTDAYQQPGNFTQASYSDGQQVQPGVLRMPTPTTGANRVIRPPGWIGWPIMFLGAVFILNGLLIRK